jgi:hypothetical protein
MTSSRKSSPWLYLWAANGIYLEGMPADNAFDGPGAVGGLFFGLVRHICGQRAACSFGDVEENGSPLIEVKVLSRSIVSLSSFLATMKMIWWVDF